MKRYILNISFKTKSFLEVSNNVVEGFKTLREAMSFKDLIDDSVDRALIRDVVTGKVIWLKEKE